MMRLAEWWGIGGVCLLLGCSVWRMSHSCFEALSAELAWYHWFAATVNVGFMAYYEGYKGFQLAFAPRVAARARYLAAKPNLVRSLLAPLFVMGYFHATRRRLLVTYSLTAGIIVLIVIFRQLPQPWHGLLDAGVLVGLSWGTVATMKCYIRIVGGGPVPWRAETPDEIGD